MRVFYDLTCPFCYLAQPYNNRIRRAGVALTELPFQAHPEVPAEGKFMGPRSGPMYDGIASRAASLGLPLKMRDWLPNSRTALAVAEWTRMNQPDRADEVRQKLFHAHFAGDLDIGQTKVVLDIAAECGVDRQQLEAALQNDAARKLVARAREMAQEMGILGTPAWESNGTIISGLQEAELARLVEQEMPQNPIEKNKE